MNAKSGMFFTTSTEARPSVHNSVSGSGARRRIRRPWLAAIMALALAVVLLAAGCGGGGKNGLLELVPEGATLIGEIEVADILEKVDLDSLLEALPDEGDVPQSIDEALEMIVGVIGIDLRDISRAVIFGDPQREDDYIGLIVRGAIDEEALVAAIQRATGTLLMETYKGRELHLAQDDSDNFAYTLLDQETLVIGNSDAVRHVIDVEAGDRDRAEGATYDAFNDLPAGLIRLALVVPQEAVQELGGGLEGFLGQQDNLGGLPINLDSFDELETFGFVLGQDGDALKFLVQLDFAGRESAANVGDLLEGLLKVAGALAPEGQDLGFLDLIQVDRGGSRLAVSIDLPISEIEDLLEGLLNVASESRASEVVVPTRSAGRGEAMAIMPGVNHVAEGRTVDYSTTPPTSGEHWGRWADCGFYEGGLPDELIVHNLEHGNIVVSYNVSAELDIATLRSALDAISLAEEWGVTRFYDKIPESMVVVAAWGRMTRMPIFDLDGMASFFAAYAGALGPERIAC
ncbi:MAG: DUF3105 domain-containing protein [Chloroflexi bacterium]|nr:DUF3105 domain-containing protein [Chloroflexota bacterium]